MENKNWVYGIHAVEALIAEQPQLVQQLWVDDKSGDSRLEAIISVAQSKQIRFKRMPRSNLDENAGRARHQGVLALCQHVGMTSEDDFLVMAEDAVNENPLVLVLDGVQDPHNLGACLRSAEAAGVSAIVIPKDNSVPLTPTVHKVSCGASWRVPMVTATNLVRLLKKLQAIGYWSVGLDMDAETSLYQVDLAVPSILIMGSEHQGIRRLTKAHCDFLAHIPMQGNIESLNVSVATGICLFEAKRQRIKG